MLLPAAKAAGVSLGWGIDDPRELEKQVPRLKLVTEVLLFVLARTRKVVAVSAHDVPHHEPYYIPEKGDAAFALSILNNQKVGRGGAGLFRARSRVAPSSAKISQPRAGVPHILSSNRPRGTLAKHMSVSSFHQHLKSVTSMSTLQYQKVLRLQEARRLMVSTMMDVGAAGRQVGYISASQFSREYGRYFRTAPTKGITRLREQGLTEPGDAR